MTYKLIDAAHNAGGRSTRPPLVAVVRAGAVFHKGKPIERPIDITPPSRTNQPKRRSPETTPSTGLDNISVIMRHRGRCCGVRESPSRSLSSRRGPMGIFSESMRSTPTPRRMNGITVVCRAAHTVRYFDFVT